MNGELKLIKGARTIRRYSIDGKPNQSESDWLTQIQNFPRMLLNGKQPANGRTNWLGDCRFIA